MSDPTTDWRKQFEALARPFQDAMAAGGAGPFAAWARMAQPDSGGLEAMLERFTRQAQDFLGLMRGVAESAGSSSDAAGVAAAWREALSAATGGSPTLAALPAIGGAGGRRREQRVAGAEAWLAAFGSQRQAGRSLRAFGPGREQQLRLQQ